MTAAFWFAPESPRPAALMRIGLGLVLLWAALIRWPYVVESYSTAGLAMPLPGLEHVPRPDAGTACVLHGVMIFALLAVAVGFRTRLALLTAFGLLAWFALLDFPGTLRKDTAIALHLLVLLAFTNGGAIWSVDARRASRDRVPLSPKWPRRLMQILVCSVYLGAAVTKLRMRDFATGDLLAFSLLDDRWSTAWLGPWLSAQPHLLVVASCATILFELAFPLLVWFRTTRRWMLGLAVLFHLSLAACLDLGTFTPTMLVALLAFVEERDLRWLQHPGCCGAAGVLSAPKDVERTRSSLRSRPGHPVWRVRNAECGVRNGSRRLRRLLELSAWLAVASGFGAASYGLQRSFDWYGVFGRRELAPPATIPSDEAKTMLADRLPPLAHYVHRVELGERVSNFHAFGENDRFEPGDVVHVLVRFVQEHPPLTLETVLVAPEGAESQPVVQSIAAGDTHALVRFRMLPEFPPGRYRVVGALEGETVFERWFRFDLDE